MASRVCAAIVAALVVVAAPAANRLHAAPRVAPVRALNWLAPGADRVAALTMAPAECLGAPSPAPSPSPSPSPAIEIGRAAFRSPLLLGGQAARAGLACETCHRSGRSNADFAFPGVSGAPGTADVTSSLFSRRRGDGIANPVPIPDLAVGPHRVAAPALRDFIAGLIVEEFDGAAPPAAVLDGLVAYVAALRGAACPIGRVPVTAAGVAGEARRAVAAARAALAAGDAPTAAVMLLAARGQLGLLDERFAGVPGAATRLRASDAALLAALVQLRAGEPGATAALAKWDGDAPALLRALEAVESRSLFDARMVEKIG